MNLLKAKAIPRKKTNKPKKLKSASVGIICQDHKLLRHFRIIDNKHTGKLLHHRHTSHLTLVVILLIVGIFLFASDNIARAQGTVSVGVIVLGPAPTVGANITSPKTGDSFVDEKTIQVAGTCSEGSFVVIKNNNLLAGSTNCTTAGIFVVEIQLEVGDNIISAMNYDNANQAGPITASIKVTFKKAETTVKTDTKKEVVIEKVIAPVLPENPSIIPGITTDKATCNDYKVNEIPTDNEPHVSIVCMPRLFQPKIEQVLGILTWGGTPPYAVSIDWGNKGELTLLSIPTQGYRTEKFTYASVGPHNIALKLKDKEGRTAAVAAAVQVSGEIKVPTNNTTGNPDGDGGVVINNGNTNNNVVDEILKTSWFKTPVPMYVMAVAVTLGFWGGDIYNRSFGAGKINKRSKKSA